MRKRRKERERKKEKEGEKRREKESEREKSRDNEQRRVFHVFINVHTLRHMSQFLSFFAMSTLYKLIDRSTILEVY